MGKHKDLIVECPHCKEQVIIEELNCRIFRHGVFKDGKQIDPHEKKELCDLYVKENKIYGCGKPFMIIEKDDKLIAEICDYI